MNEFPTGRLSSLLTMLAAFLLAACAPSQGETPPLEGAALGGPFTLTDQSGRRVSDTDFDGKYRLVYFGYTFCPDVCPVDLRVLGQGLSAFEKEDAARAAKVVPIFITTDPERDTPSVMREYVEAMHPRMVGLTGSPQEIAAVAKAYGVYYKKRQEEGMAGYLVDHNRVALLFGPDGKPLAIVPHDQGPQGVAEELDRWVR